jgi:hypothetical protein
MSWLERWPHLQTGDWRPMSEAKKGHEHPPVLLKLKDEIPREGREDLKVWNGLIFIGIHPGLAKDGFDVGWQFAAPVGHGGFPDDWFDGFKELK